MTGKNVNNISAFKFKSIVIQFNGQLHSCNMLLHEPFPYLFKKILHVSEDEKLFFLIHHVNKGVTIKLCTQFNVFCVNILLETEDCERLSCI